MPQQVLHGHQLSTGRQTHSTHVSPSAMPFDEVSRRFNESTLYVRTSSPESVYSGRASTSLALAEGRYSFRTPDWPQQRQQ